jgi:hypothetical protein
MWAVPESAIQRKFTKNHGKTKNIVYKEALSGHLQ